ncbi:MAG: serine protease Do [Planctomycetota bacterium]|jgi:serine protease Do
MIRMRDVDLSMFQFDYDLTWAGLMMEPDGTVLGRYGAGSRDSMHYNSLKGLRSALERALKLHGSLETNKAALALKNQKNITLDRPRKLPNPKIRKIVEKDTQRKNCVHCHMVQEGLNRVIEQKPGYHPDQIQSLYPVPERFGVVLDVDHGLKVARVLPKTPAALAGLRSGDELLRIAGQPLISTADIIWALRSVGDPGVAEVELLRDGKKQSLAIKMPAKWKLSDLSWRTSIHGLYPRLQLWLEPAPKNKRRRAKVADGNMALEVLGVFGDEVRKAGVKTGDVVVGIGTWHPDVGPKDFTQYTRLNFYQRGSKMPLTVVRGKRTLQLSIQL